MLLIESLQVFHKLVRGQNLEMAFLKRLSVIHGSDNEE